MVMKVEPIYKAMKHVENTWGKPKFVLLTPQGQTFDQYTAERLSKLSHICLVCGRYEGVDERVLILSMRKFPWAIMCFPEENCPLLS